MSDRRQKLRNRLKVASQKPPVDDDPGVLRRKQAEVIERIMEAFEADREREPDCGCEHKGAVRAAHAAHEVVEAMMNEADAEMIASGGHTHDDSDRVMAEGFAEMGTPIVTPQMLKEAESVAYEISMDRGQVEGLKFLAGRYEGAANVVRVLRSATEREQAVAASEGENADDFMNEGGSVSLTENEAWNIKAEIDPELDQAGEGWMGQLRDPTPLLDLWGMIV